MSEQKDITVILALIRDRLDWHFGLGIGAFVLFVGIFFWLIRFYLPSEFKRESAEITRAVQTQIDKMSMLQLDKVAVQIEEAAKLRGKVDPESVRTMGFSVLDFTSSARPDIAAAAWKAASRTLGYYSTIAGQSNIAKIKELGLTVKVGNKSTECMDVAPDGGQTVHGIIFENCTQHLDPILGRGAAERALLLRNMVFVDSHIIYSGGPLDLHQIYFENCTFELQPTSRSEVLARTIFAEEGIGHLSVP